MKDPDKDSFTESMDEKPGNMFENKIFILGGRCKILDGNYMQDIFGITGETKSWWSNILQRIKILYWWKYQKHGRCYKEAYSVVAIWLTIWLLFLWSNLQGWASRGEGNIQAFPKLN